jgi:hypothetical protein
VPGAPHSLCHGLLADPSRSCPSRRASLTRHRSLDVLTSGSEVFVVERHPVAGATQVVVLADERPPPGEDVILARQRAVTGGYFLWPIRSAVPTAAKMTYRRHATDFRNTVPLPWRERVCKVTSMSVSLEPTMAQGIFRQPGTPSSATSSATLESRSTGTGQADRSFQR